MALGSRLLFLTKWVLVPAAVGAACFYFVGPRLGATPEAKADKVSATTPDAAEPSASPESFPQPKVSIQASSVDADTLTAESPPPRKKRRRRPRPSPSPTPDTAAPATPIDNGAGKMDGN